MVQKKVKRTLSIVGIILFLAVIAIYGSQSFSVAGLNKDIVYTARFSTAICSALIPNDVIDTFAISGKSDSRLKVFPKESSFDLLSDKKWFAYRCGYGDLNGVLKGKSGAYTNRCNLDITYTSTGTLPISGSGKVFLCKNTYDFSKNPENDKNNCKLHDKFKFNYKVQLDPLNNEEGFVVPSELQNKYEIVAISLDNGIGVDAKADIKVNGNKYGLDIIDGSGKGQTYEDCSTEHILSIPKAIDSTLQTTKEGEAPKLGGKLDTFQYFGKQQVAFGKRISWIWAYQSTIGNQVINHPILGNIYVPEKGKYIPVTTTQEGIKIAYEEDLKESNLIECVPNPALGCSKDAKIITNPEDLSCDSFSGFRKGDELQRSDGLVCNYDCVNGKPQYESCKQITSTTCSQGQAYVLNEGCKDIDSINNPPLNKQEKTDLTPLYIMGIAFLLVLILILIYQRTRGNKK